jgi:hypothetical protein
VRRVQAGIARAANRGPGNDPRRSWPQGRGALGTTRGARGGWIPPPPGRLDRREAGRAALRAVPAGTAGRRPHEAWRLYDLALDELSDTEARELLDLGIAEMDAVEPDGEPIEPDDDKIVQLWPPDDDDDPDDDPDGGERQTGPPGKGKRVELRAVRGGATLARRKKGSPRARNMLPVPANGSARFAPRAPKPTGTGARPGGIAGVGMS